MLLICIYVHICHVYWLLNGPYQYDALCYLAQINYLLLSLILFLYLLFLYCLSGTSLGWIMDSTLFSSMSLFSSFRSGIPMSLNSLAFFRISVASVYTLASSSDTSGFGFLPPNSWIIISLPSRNWYSRNTLKPFIPWGPHLVSLHG